MNCCEINSILSFTGSPLSGKVLTEEECKVIKRQSDRIPYHRLKALFDNVISSSFRRFDDKILHVALENLSNWCFNNNIVPELIYCQHKVIIEYPGGCMCDTHKHMTVPKYKNKDGDMTREDVINNMKLHKYSYNHFSRNFIDLCTSIGRDAQRNMCRAALLTKAVPLEIHSSVKIIFYKDADTIQQYLLGYNTAQVLAEKIKTIYGEERYKRFLRNVNGYDNFNESNELDDTLSLEKYKMEMLEIGWVD